MLLVALHLQWSKLAKQCRKKREMVLSFSHHGSCLDLQGLRKSIGSEGDARALAYAVFDLHMSSGGLGHPKPGPDLDMLSVGLGHPKHGPDPLTTLFKHDPFI